MTEAKKPVVLITGAAGNIDRSLAATLADAYAIVGLDQKGRLPADQGRLTKGASVEQAMRHSENRTTAETDQLNRLRTQHVSH